MKRENNKIGVSIGRIMVITCAGLIMSLAVSAATPVYYDMYVERMCMPSENVTLYLPAVSMLVVPAGALSSPTTIGMHLMFTVNSAEDHGVMMTFSPHNTTFNQPVRVRLSLLMMYFFYGDEVGVYYHDESDDTWELVDSFTLTWQNSNYWVELDHFSLYAFTKLKTDD